MVTHRPSRSVTVFFVSLVAHRGPAGATLVQERNAKISRALMLHESNGRLGVSHPPTDSRISFCLLIEHRRGLMVNGLYQPETSGGMRYWHLL